MYLKKVVLPVSLVVLTTGCLEVDDDSNDQLTAALLAQNELLAEQIAQGQNTVSVSGLIVDALDSKTGMAGTIMVRSATTVYAENVESTDGKFTISGLPANSTLEIVVSSSDGRFLTRAFTLQTGDATSGNAEKSMGALKVSSAKEYEIAVLNGETNMPITGLEFRADSSNGLVINDAEFLHKSAFDEANGVYKITLPEYLEPTLLLSNDADRDGERDWIAESNKIGYSGTNMFISFDYLEDLDTILLNENDESDSSNTGTPVQFRLSVINEAGQTITGAEIEADNNKESVMATFDEATSQYVINISHIERTAINIGSTTFEGEAFSSASLQLNNDFQDKNILNVSGSNLASNSYYNVELTDVINLSLTLETSNNSNSTNVEIVSSTNPSLNNSGVYSVFYSQPVEPVVAEIALYNLEDLTVVRGNDSDNDLILPGNTHVTYGKAIPVQVEMSLNNTKLTITPSQPLQSNRKHSYQIGDVKVTATGDLLNLNDDKEFGSAVVVSDTAFSINSLFADNHNQTNNGTAIVSQNTAGVPASPFNQSSNVYIFFPEEINQLRQFTLNTRSVIDDGAQSLRNQRIEVVRNGDIQPQRVAVVAMAENENYTSSYLISNSYHSVTSRASITVDGFYYRVNASAYLSDNTDSETNSITFDYAYETLAGEVETGTITLPVQ